MSGKYKSGYNNQLFLKAVEAAIDPVAWAEQITNLDVRRGSGLTRDDLDQSLIRFDAGVDRPVASNTSPVSSPDKQPRMDEKTLARSADPATSKAAAKMVKSFAPTIHALIISALKNGPGTFYDIAEWLVIEPSTIWRRLNELERKGLIETTGEERKGPTGRLCRVWRLKSL